MIVYKLTLAQKKLLDGVEFILTKHFKDRLRERKEFSNLDFSNFLQHIRTKLADIKPEGYFCFTSKSLGQSIIAFWDAMTFLPRE